MEITVKTHKRVVDYSVDAGAVLALRLEGKSLTEIRAALAPMVSLATISRALSRAQEDASE